jgi:phosphoenolpyruvate-protein phosphotransferase (PTS system enzyme I)
MAAGPSPALAGVGVSPGLALGPVLCMGEPPGAPEDGGLLEPGARASAAERVRAAMADVAAELQARAAQAHGDAVAVLEATAMMAADPALEVAAVERVTVHGLPPERAVWDAAGEVADVLRGLGGYLGERARDVLDVRDRIVARLRGVASPGVPVSDVPFVLVARDLAPADTATLDLAVVRALVTEEGGPTSHTAILARSLGIPAVVAVAGATGLVEGTVVLVDGGAGTVVADPGEAEQERVRRRAGTGQRVFDGHGVTADGKAVTLLANVGDPSGSDAAARANAEGIGLFRTEFCFLDRQDAPTVEEQVQLYREVLAPMRGKRVVVRTLDAGADKPLPYLSSTDEPNPALGVRGLRTSWRSPELLDDQLRAISLAAQDAGAQVWVMAPMVATRDEAEAFAGRCSAHGLDHAGVMVEVPAAALTAAAILEVASFASIGTNDLAQYTLAADRMLGDLAALNDPFQPALLRLIEFTASAGAAARRPVGVCGEAAADPAMACVLVGLGVTSLSMTPAALGNVGAALHGATVEQCTAAARAAVSAASAVAARQAARACLPHLSDLGL